MRPLHLLFALLLVAGRHGAYAQYGDEDEEPYGGGEGYGGGGGYGGDDMDMPPPPPPEEVQELVSVEDFEAFVDSTDASIIAAFAQKQIVDPNAVMPEGWDAEEDGDWEAPVIENPMLTSFNSISSTNYGYRFAYTTAPDVLQKLKCKSSGLFLYRSPKFLSVKDGDRPRERFPSDKLTESAVSNWLASKAQPLVGLYSPSTKDRYKSAVLTIFMNLDFDKNAQSVAYVLKRARKVAAALKGKRLSIAVGSLSDMSFELSDYGLKSTKPTADILMGIRDGSSFYSATQYFDESGSTAAFSGTTLSAFANAFVAGELSPYVKPEEPTPPEDDHSDSGLADEDGSDEEDKEDL